MIIKGKALKVARKHVVSPCGFDGLAGYKPNADKYGADSMLSFMPCTSKVTIKVTSLTIEGKQAKVIIRLASLR